MLQLTLIKINNQFMKIVTLIMFSLGILVISCGENKEQATDQKKQEVAEDNQGSKESNTADDQELAKQELAGKEEANTDPSSTENRQNDLGMTPGLPGDFPKDVPTPRNSKTLGSLNSTEGTVVTFESSEMVPEIISYYKEEMSKNGYELIEGSENLVSDKGGVLSWKKNGKEVGIMMGYDKDKQITSLVITYK